MNWQTWVVLPHPVLPLIKTTGLSWILVMISSFMLKMGNWDRDFKLAWISWSVLLRSLQLEFKSSEIWSMLAEAKGPSSMLQPNQGFQLAVGGDQETTPPSDLLEGGKRSSRNLVSWSKGRFSVPSTPCPEKVAKILNAKNINYPKSYIFIFFLG